MFFSEDYIFFLIVASTFAGMLIILFLAAQHSLRAKKEWEKAARRLDLTYRHSHLWFTNQEVFGSYRDHSLRAFVQVVGHGKSATKYTVYEMTLDDAWRCGVHVESRRRGLLENLIPVFRRSELIEVGVPHLDNAFYVTGNLPSAIRDVLRDPNIIRVLRGTSSHYERLEISDGTVRVRHHGVANNGLRMRTTFNRLADLAGELNDALWPEPREEPDFLFPDQDTSRNEEPSPVW